MNIVLLSTDALKEPWQNQGGIRESLAQQEIHPNGCRVKQRYPNICEFIPEQEGNASPFHTVIMTKCV